MLNLLLQNITVHFAYNLDYDECSSSPCQPGQQCVDDVNKYTCVGLISKIDISILIMCIVLFPYRIPSFKRRVYKFQRF